MSASIPNEESQKVFKRVAETQQKTPSNTESVKRVQEDIEKRLGQRNPRSSFNESEIQKVADLVDKLLERKMTTTSQESRVAPAAHPETKRHHAYEQPIPLPPPQNPERTGSDQTIRGIYTLPSTDQETTLSENPPLDLNPSHNLSGKLASNLLALIQVILILIFAIFINYDENNVSSISRSYIESRKTTSRPKYDNNFYHERPQSGYIPEQDSRYGPEGPYAQPVTTALDPTQNLHQFYYRE